MSGVLIASALLITMSGCGITMSGCGGTDPASEATPDPVASVPPGMPASSPSVADPATPSAVPPSVPSVPLTGPVATLDVGTVRLPAEWTVEDGGADWALRLCPPERLGAGCVMFTDIHDPLSVTTVTPEVLDGLVRSVREQHVQTWTRKPDVTLGGLAFYHLVDDTDPALHYEEYGSLHGERDVVLDFALSKMLMKPAQQRRYIDAIAGSYQPG